MSEANLLQTEFVHHGFLGINTGSKIFNDGLKRLYGNDVYGLISSYYRARKLGIIV